MTKHNRKAKRLRGGQLKTTKAKPLPIIGDLGPGTEAATFGTEVIMFPEPNPNRIARRHRISGLDRLERAGSLSMRQLQAGREIEIAYARVQSLTSGGELREQVDRTARPDATMAAQVDAMSRLKVAMDAVPSAMRDVVEAVCWFGESVSDGRDGRAAYNRMGDFKVALDLVANRLRY